MDFTEAEARRIMAAGLGKAELEFVTSISAPLWWVEPGPSRTPRNGTAFFIDTGEAVFAVTAAHVIEGYRASRSNGPFIPLQIGSGMALDLDGRNSVIDIDSDIDIATLRISRDEVAALGKTILGGSQPAWPPPLPAVDRGVLTIGYPAVETRWDDPESLCFAAAPVGGVATSVSQRDVSTQFERQRWIDLMGLGFPAENFDFGGISGGPMVMVIERSGIRSYALAGVVHQGPAIANNGNIAIAGFEVIRARQARFIGADGALDRDAWQSC